MIRGVHYEPNRKKCEPRSEFEFTHPRSVVEAHLVRRRVFGWHFPPAIKPGGGDGGVTNSIKIPGACSSADTSTARTGQRGAYDDSKSGNLSASESASEWVMNE
jgi:hypothetical protein